jgi:hypothetical protein
LPSLHELRQAKPPSGSNQRSNANSRLLNLGSSMLHGFPSAVYLALEQVILERISRLDW